MAERLTKEFYCTYEPKTWTQKVNNKLGKIEDIMDKYGIERLEDLDSELQDRLDYKCLLDECFKAQHDRDTWKKACELACQETPFHCPNPPERYNAQNEYGSDEPFYIEEVGCEFADSPDMCLNCQIQYYYDKAKMKTIKTT